MELIVGMVTLLTFLGGVITYIINNEVKLLKRDLNSYKDDLTKLEAAQAAAEVRYHDDVKEIFEAIKTIGKEINDFKVSQAEKLAAMDSSIKTDLGSIKFSLASNYVSKEECDKRSDR
jgi:DNA anti-recombination protein RmuC